MLKKNISPVAIVLFLLSICAFFSSCRKECTNTGDVRQDKVELFYSVTYDASKDMTTLTALFSAPCGRRDYFLTLGSGASLIYNGTTMPLDSSASYITYIAGRLDSVAFEYTDLDAETYQNTIYLVEAEFPTLYDSIPVNTDYEIKWIGPPSTQGPSQGDVILSQYNSINQIPTQIGDTSIIINLSQPGTYSFGLSRNYIHNYLLEAPASNSWWRSFYFSKTFTLKVY